MQTGKVVRTIDNGLNMQVLCADERGLLSVYFEHKLFSMFTRFVQKSGLKLCGLQIEFNRQMVHVPALRKNFKALSHAKLINTY